MVRPRLLRQTDAVTDDLLSEDAAAFAASNVHRERPPMPKPSQVRRYGNIMWTIPVALVLTLPGFVLAQVSLCGLFSCGWGGTTQLPWLTAIFVLAIASMWALAIAMPPARTVAGRSWTAFITGAIVTIPLTMYFFREFAIH